MRNNKIKILFAPAEFTFSNRAGSKPSWLYYYLEELTRREVEITALFDNIDPKSAFAKKNLKIITRTNNYNPTPSLIETLKFFMWQISVTKKLIKQDKFDVIHHFGNFGDRTSFNLPLLIGVFKDTPFVFGPIESRIVPLNNRNHLRWLKRWKDKLIKLSYKLLFAKLVTKTITKSSVTICVTPKAIDFFKSMCNRKYFFIPPGIHNQKNRKHHKMDKTYPRLVSVSELIDVKRIPLALEVVHVLKKKYPNVEYTLIGDGKRRKKIERKITDLNLNETVKLLGHIPLDEVIQELKRSHIFLHTSSFESYGQALLEAMDCGLPVVATNSPGPETIVKNGETGYLIEKSKIEKKEFASKITKLIEDENFRKTVEKNSYKRALLFSWKNIVNQYLDIYKSLAK